MRDLSGFIFYLGIVVMPPVKSPQKNSKALFNYSRFAIAFLLMKTAVADADVIYTDIEPDKILANDNDHFYLDINDDSQNDFKFRNESFDIGGYWTTGSIYYIFFRHFERIIGTTLFGNSFAGDSADYGTTFSALIRWLPFALNGGEVVDENLTFQPVYQQLLALKTAWDTLGEIYTYGGHWFPEMFNHYLGVRFQDEAEIMHYGWIRCDVKDEGRTLIIKDYAYESEADYPIIAGDTAHFVGMDDLTIDVTVYSFNNDVIIYTDEYKNSKIEIFDLNGKLVVQEIMQTCDSKIDMRNFPSGNYLVSISNAEGRYTREIFLE